MRSWIVGMFLMLCCLLGMAQSDDVAQNVKALTPEDLARFRAVLAQPTPQNASPEELKNHFMQQEVAAGMLGDSQTHLAVFREWEAKMPASLNVNNYIIELKRAGLTEEALQKREAQVRGLGGGVYPQLYRNNYVGDLMDMGRFEAAQKELDVVNANVLALRRRTLNDWEMVYLRRIESEAFSNSSRLQSRFGKLAPAIDSAQKAVALGRESLKLAILAPDGFGKNGAAEVPHAVGTLTFALNRSINAYKEAGQYDEAEQGMRDLLLLTKSFPMRPRYLMSIYSSLVELRIDLHEFALAESYIAKADAIASAQSLVASAPPRINLARLRLQALEGQHRAADALAELARLDQLAQGDAALGRQVHFPFIRAYAYLLDRSHPAEAAALFQEVSSDVEKRYSAHHFYIAQAHGLQAVALWRTGTAGNKTQALALLREAVQDYMRYDNLAYETRGYSQDIRDLVFATYLEALFATPGDNTMDALVPADWVRGGAVQEALTDAAVRAAAATPALVGLVRDEQDAKHEMEALRKYLADEGGSITTPTPDIAAKMRARIDELNATRRALQADIKARFPDYDQLVRPTPPTVAEIAHALADDEALLMLLPVRDATYVWAVSHDGKNSAVRVELPQAALLPLVASLRSTLDFAQMGRRLTPFNAVAASDLYQRLLAPLHASIAGKKHLIIAAGGALGQIPFGVLLTEPGAASDASAPWLIKQAAITQVPSLSAWMALRQYAHNQTAPEAFIAWGDPQFALSAPPAASAQMPNRQLALQRQSRAVDLEKEAPHSALRYTDIPALPETRDELLAIAGTLKADPGSDLHLGKQATKASVLSSSQSGELQRKKVIAFATHGLMAGDLPHLTQPALALASTGEEGRDPLGALLTLDEVLNLKLNADWVILSACNTAAADGMQEEALSGLARGFFYAGSRSLLVTHWAVESGSAVQLTTRTMAHYTGNPNERKSESLRQAMLAVMAVAGYAHPAYWAPYSLVGDGGR